MKRKFILLLFAVAGVIAVSYSLVTSDHTTVIGNDKTVVNAASEAQLRVDMRKLWEEHVMWTRNVIFNIMDDLPGGEQATKRLLRNQDDIGEAIKPYYGADAGKKLSDLLHTHITQAADLLKALKANNDNLVRSVNEKWTTNADEISEFLSKANPNWKFGDMKDMMHDHLKFTTDEASARKKKDYDADVKAYDKVHDEILKMADILSDGIVKQFPDKFKGKEEMGMGK